MKTEVRLIPETYTIRGEKIEITADARINTENDQQVFDEQLDESAINLALDKYRKIHGVMTIKRIKAVRHGYGLSQRDFATLVGWSATTVATYETGALPSKANNQVLLALESDRRLAQSFYRSAAHSMTKSGQKAFEKSVAQASKSTAESMIELGISNRFKRTDYSEYSGFNVFNLKKFTNMVLYFVDRVPRLTKTKLNKLLFYTDFKYFAQNTISISGIPYARLPHGPVPDGYSLLYGALEDAELIVEQAPSYQEHAWYYFEARANFDATLFNTQELAVMADTVERFEPLSAQAISQVSHEEQAWLANETGSLISYFFAEKLSSL